MMHIPVKVFVHFNSDTNVLEIHSVLAWLSINLSGNTSCGAMSGTLVKGMGWQMRLEILLEVKVIYQAKPFVLYSTDNEK